jgi:hypothetical protein
LNHFTVHVGIDPSLDLEPGVLPELCLFTSSQQKGLTPAERMEDKHSTPFTRFAPGRQVSQGFFNSLFLLPV